MSGLKRMRAAVLAAAVALPLTAGGSAAAYGKYDKPVMRTPGMSRGAVAEGRRDVSALQSLLGLPVVPVSWHRDVRWPEIPYCDPHTGPYQTQIERLLHLLMYGQQTRASCVAIRHYQRTHGIHPAIGYAGPVTLHRLRGRHPHRHGHMRLVHRLRPRRRVTHITHTTGITRITNPNAAGRCPTGNFRIACVDQNRQIMWVQHGRRIVFGPVRIRTGYGRYRTRNGMHRVYWKHRYHVSSLYGMPMPYAQFFDRGEAFHGIYGSVRSRHRSFGCVNMRLADARRLWSVLRRGDRVYLWGHVPGHA
ncbi:L,D-transpeptidase [Streptomyces sp. RB6PN25]|uniref:L,D-transpeptidase n=1 Tax=Streptomyces humicola TaxID=2953240 RepID=A0ABT1PY89_9ACTN|nr:L,D-transpeptidase [Streptomyces humicola]MCQ4082641.1 L,D-transpeptidase [Streptomyces humicola]